ncbi:site-specific integrase [uncultured Adlercreutzia sp.]|uniref:site-specific integrase n=1 Tax=uncultured Adlercreutzia sp. TaxID=875803 RepID=UPI0026747191|nr:site-specific integrase [uncultured Adlercreutzia sp.]
MASNPCGFADAPSLDTVERKAMRRDGIVALVEKLSPKDPIQFAMRLMVKTSIRRGRAHGLSVGDVDRDAMALRIRHSYDDGGNLKEPKTKAGVRDLPPSRRAPWRTSTPASPTSSAATATPASASRRTAPCLGLRPRSWATGWETGCSPHSSTRWWTRERKGLGLERWTLHELRHSYITELARRKVDPKVLQTIAGHAKFSTTMDIYNHVDMEDKKNALKVVDW